MGKIGYPRLIIQSYCLEVVENWRLRWRETNSIGAAIYEDCTFLYSEFSNVKSDYCLREANKIVHILAYD